MRIIRHFVCLLYCLRSCFVCASDGYWFQSLGLGNKPDHCSLTAAVLSIWTARRISSELWINSFSAEMFLLDECSWGVSSFSSSERSSSSLLEIPISSASVFLIVERKRHEWHEILHRSQLLPTLMCLRFHTLPKTALSIALSYTHLTRRINEINSTHTSHIKQKISRHSQRNYVVRYNKEPPGGLEPSTCWLQISCSSQLSYRGVD